VPITLGVHFVFFAVNLAFKELKISRYL